MRQPFRMRQIRSLLLHQRRRKGSIAIQQRPKALADALFSGRDLPFRSALCAIPSTQESGIQGSGYQQ